MDLMQWLTTDLNGEFILTLLVSMLPVVELRGGIPFGVAAGLPVWAAYLAAVIETCSPSPSLWCISSVFLCSCARICPDSTAWWIRWSRRPT